MIPYFTKGLNIKSLTITVFVVFAYIFISDMVIHGFILDSTYQATPELWRPKAEMQSFMPWMILGQFLIAKFFVVLFAKGYEGTGFHEGIRFGLYVGLLITGTYLIQYAVSPLPCNLVLAWIGFGLVQSILGGVIAAFVYKRP